MKQMKIPAGMMSQSFELSKEELKHQKQLDNYCKKYLTGNYKYKRYMLEENDKLPTAFIVEDEMGYELRMTTPYGVKKEILHEMQVNNMLNLQKAKGYSFDSYQTNEEWQKKIKQNAIDYADSFDGSKWFVIMGITGSGKSHICTSMIFRLASRGIKTRYVSWLAFKNELKGDLSNSKSKIHVLKKYPVLYIDDFLKTGNDDTPTSYDLEVATEILWHRYENNLPTILSTEYDFSKVAGFNNAMVGRINQMAKGYVNRIGNNEKRDWRAENANDCKK